MTIRHGIAGWILRLLLAPWPWARRQHASSRGQPQCPPTGEHTGMAQGCAWPSCGADGLRPIPVEWRLRTKPLLLFEGSFSPKICRCNPISPSPSPSAGSPCPPQQRCRTVPISTTTASREKCSRSVTWWHMKTATATGSWIWLATFFPHRSDKSGPHSRIPWVKKWISGLCTCSLNSLSSVSAPDSSLA